MTKQRFQRLLPLVGEAAFRQMENSHVMIFGVGGVGSFAAESLARHGVGTLTLVDDDEIVIHNINRQLHALTSTLGQKKVTVMAERLRNINPAIHLHSFTQRLTPENVADFFTHRPDYILDAIDDVDAKVALMVYSHERSIPLLAAMGTGNKLEPGRLQVEDISATAVCPLCRRVRRKLKDGGIEGGIPVVYSREVPRLKGIEAEGKTVPASSCLVPSVAGLLMSAWVIEQIMIKENKKKEGKENG